MRITTKGQVTIPLDVRARLGLLPRTEVQFRIEGQAAVLAGVVIGAIGGLLRPAMQSTFGLVMVGACLGEVIYQLFKVEDIVDHTWGRDDVIPAAAFGLLGVGTALYSRARLRARARDRAELGE
jgi:hypothetical protein